MTKVKNTSHTLFRYQEYIWKPGEILIFNEMGNISWEDSLAVQLCSAYGNLKIVTDEETKFIKKEKHV